MRVIELDGGRWNTQQGALDALLPALQAPEWHGHSFDAIAESIAIGGMNGVEPPYTIKITGSRSMGPDVLHFLEELRAFVAELVEEQAHRTGYRRHVEFEFV